MVSLAIRFDKHREHRYRELNERYIKYLKSYGWYRKNIKDVVEEARKWKR